MIRRINWPNRIFARGREKTRDEVRAPKGAIERIAGKALDGGPSGRRVVEGNLVALDPRQAGPVERTRNMEAAEEIAALQKRLQRIIGRSFCEGEELGDIWFKAVALWRLMEPRPPMPKFVELDTNTVLHSLGLVPLSDWFDSSFLCMCATSCWMVCENWLDSRTATRATSARAARNPAAQSEPPRSGASMPLLPGRCESAWPLAV